jgi:hypothetical protein
VGVAIEYKIYTLWGGSGVARDYIYMKKEKTGELENRYEAWAAKGVRVGETQTGWIREKATIGVNHNESVNEQL